MESRFVQCPVECLEDMHTIAVTGTPSLDETSELKTLVTLPDLCYAIVLTVSA
jgi:hypothetical protein